jgi:hypothetical protein
VGFEAECGTPATKGIIKCTFNKNRVTRPNGTGSANEAVDLIPNRREKNHEQRSRQKEGFKKRTDKNLAGKKDCQKRKEE